MILFVSLGVSYASDDAVSDLNSTDVLHVAEDAEFLSVESQDIESSNSGDGDVSDTLMAGESFALKNSADDDYEIVTSNVTRYDFDDYYKVKVVDGSGRAVYGGHVDFFVNHKFATACQVNYLGMASFNLNSYIDSKGTYEVVSIYSPDDGESEGVLARQSIEVDDVPMSERDTQVIFENIKLYDLGEAYSVKVVNKNGNPVRKGYVYFIVYDRIFYSNLSDEGIATCYLPGDLNIAGNLLVWSFYSDGELYDLSACEQISIGTRTLISLDQSSFGARVVSPWNGYDYVYSDGKYVASLGDDLYHVIELSGNRYLLKKMTARTSTDLKNCLYFFSLNSRYDVVELNLLSGTTYVLDYDSWNDQEWGYASRFSYGQLIINGNGSTVKGDMDDLNFMYIGSEANVCIFNVTLKEFEHCFMNHGKLYCENCNFRDNHALKMDVLVEGSGTVIHNYNTAIFDDCGFYNNEADCWSFNPHMAGSILYAEPYSLNVFKGFHGHYYLDSFYCCNYSTTVIYSWEMEYHLNQSLFEPRSYFVLADAVSYTHECVWTVNVSNVNQLKEVFRSINSFVNATSIVINLAPGNYAFSTSDYADVRSYDWREPYFNQDPLININWIKDKYLLEVGLCPVTINGNLATISVSDNDEDDDYHFAFIGKYGSLTLNNVIVKNFNTAFYVLGSVTANNSMFSNNVIDYTMLDGDLGGVFRSFGGSVICRGCLFTGNEGDDDSNDIYADMESYVEFVNCRSPTGIVKDSYLKTVKIGKYTITATYKGQTVRNTVKVKQILTSKKTVKVKRTAKKLVLKAKLKKKLKGKKIIFKFKGKKYRAKTNKKGIAKVTVKKKVLRKLKKGKAYKATISYFKISIKTSVIVK